MTINASASPPECFDGPCEPDSKFVCWNCPIRPLDPGDIFLSDQWKAMTWPHLKVFFVINGTTPTKAFLRAGINRFLMSAYSIKYQQAGRPGTLSLLSGHEWILDSGMISAWKKGRRDWMFKQDYIAELARQLKPTYVTHLDIPVEKHLLNKNGMSRSEAIERTVENARIFMDSDVGDATKIFTLQGWTITDYLDCLDSFADFGIVDECHKGRARLGVGTMCLRKPGQGLFGIARSIRRKTEGISLHIFGVGQIAYQKRLSEMGVDSTDTGSTLIQWAFSERYSRNMQGQELID